MQPSPPSAKCPVCKSDLVLVTDPESREHICKKCGMILSDKVQDMINRSEWYDTFDAIIETKDRHHRTGIPASLARYDMGLSTVIAKTNRDASEKIINAAT
jgi:transcription initiation factor TFIIB